MPAAGADPSMVRPLIDWAAGSAETRDRRLDLRLADIRGNHDLDHRPVRRRPDHDRLVGIAVEEVDPEAGPTIDLLVRRRHDGDPARGTGPGLVLVRHELGGQAGRAEDGQLEPRERGPARRVDGPDPAAELRFVDSCVPQRPEGALRAETPGIAAVRGLAVDLDRDPRLEVRVGALHLLAVDALRRRRPPGDEGRLPGPRGADPDPGRRPGRGQPRFRAFLREGHPRDAVGRRNPRNAVRRRDLGRRPDGRDLARGVPAVRLPRARPDPVSYT